MILIDSVPATGIEPQPLYAYEPEQSEAIFEVIMEELQSEAEQPHLIGQEFGLMAVPHEGFPPTLLMAMALAMRLIKTNGARDFDCEINHNVDRQSIEVRLELPFDSIVDRPNQVSIVDLAKNIEIHQQNARELLSGFMRVLRNNPDQVTSMADRSDELQELIDAAHTLLEQDIDEKPVDIPLQSIVRELPKAGSRRLNVRKKSN